MKIALSHIDGTNHGDQIIYYSSKYLLEKSLKENNVTDYEIVTVDVCMGKKVGIKTKILDRIYRKVKHRILNRKIEKATTEEEKMALIKEKWHTYAIYKQFLKTEMEKMKDIDCFVFSGGGIIKYHAQFYHYTVDMITEYCDEHNIPVIIIGAGVEGYDENAPECRYLKNALNRNCVKYLSVRDDYDTLVKCYMTNPNIETELVCDPAFWSGERYRITVPEHKEKIIGLNVIREAIWKDYMYDIDAKSLREMYKDLILRLVKEGYHVELFSNGVKGDTGFIKLIIQSFPEIGELRAKNIVTVSNEKHPRRFMKRLASYERFMAVRLHSSIVGTSLGVPNISLVWCVKQPLFGQQTGTIDNFITKENFNVDYVYDKLMNAKPYVMDYDYRNTVYNGLNKHITNLVNGGSIKK